MIRLAVARSFAIIGGAYAVGVWLSEQSVPASWYAFGRWLAVHVHG